MTHRRCTRFCWCVPSYINLSKTKNMREKRTKLHDIQRTLHRILTTFARRSFWNKNVHFELTSATNRKMSPKDQLEIHACIKFCHDLGKTPPKALTLIEVTKRWHLETRALLFIQYRRFLMAETVFRNRKVTDWIKKNYDRIMVTLICKCAGR